MRNDASIRCAEYTGGVPTNARCGRRVLWSYSATNDLESLNVAAVILHRQAVSW